jgi:hypothetical protein
MDDLATTNDSLSSLANMSLENVSEPPVAVATPLSAYLSASAASSSFHQNIASPPRKTSILANTNPDLINTLNKMLSGSVQKGELSSD